MNLFFLGPPNTFSEQAAKILAGNLPAPVEVVAAPSLEAVAREIVGGATEATGVLPYYNFLEGLVQESLDLIVEYRLHIADACRLPISFAIGGWAGTEPIVFSHQKGLAQCSDYLRKNMPGARLEAVVSNANAAEQVGCLKHGYAIAGETALEAAGVPLLARDIANRRHGKVNFTDFLLLRGDPSEMASPPPDHHASRTMVAISPEIDEPGLLAVILGQVAFHRINVAKIHSRPLFLEAASHAEPQMFYLELMCAMSSPAFVLCVDSLRHRFGRVEAVRLLGQFPDLQ